MRFLAYLILFTCLLPLGLQAAEYTRSSPVFELTVGDVSHGVATHPGPGLAVREHGEETDFLVAWRNYEEERMWLQRVRLAAGDPEASSPYGEPLDVSSTEGIEWQFIGSFEAAYNARRDEYLVIWRGGYRKQDGVFVSGLFVRRVDAAAFLPVGEVRKIAAAGSMLPQVTWNAEGGHYVAAWLRYAAGRAAIETRAIGSDGMPATAVSQVDRTDGRLSNEECEQVPALISHDDGHVLAFANSNGGSGNGAFNIVLRRLDSLGQAVGGRVVVPRQAGDDTQFMCNPELVSLGKSLLVHWRGYGWNRADWPIRGAILEMDAAAATAPEYFPAAGHSAKPAPVFGVAARQLDNDDIMFLWLERTAEADLPENHEAFVGMSQRFTREGVVINETPETLFTFGTASPASLDTDGRTPFLFTENGGHALVGWLEREVSWYEGSRSALRGLMLSGEAPPDAPPVCDQLDIESPGPDIPQDAPLWISADIDCEYGTVRVHVGNAGDVSLTDMTLSLVFKGEADEHEFSTEHCDWEDNSCDLGEFSAHEIHALTFYLSAALEDMHGALVFTVSARSGEETIVEKFTLVLGDFQAPTEPGHPARDDEEESAERNESTLADLPEMPASDAPDESDENDAVEDASASPVESGGETGESSKSPTRDDATTTGGGSLVWLLAAGVLGGIRRRG